MSNSYQSERWLYKVLGQNKSHEKCGVSNGVVARFADMPSTVSEPANTCAATYQPIGKLCLEWSRRVRALVRLCACICHCDYGRKRNKRHHQTAPSIMGKTIFHGYVHRNVMVAAIEREKKHNRTHEVCRTRNAPRLCEQTTKPILFIGCHMYDICICVSLGLRETNYTVFPLLGVSDRPFVFRNYYHHLK